MGHFVNTAKRVHKVPIATVTNWVATNNINLIWRSEVWNGSHRAKTKVSARRAVFLLEVLGENWFPCLLQLLKVVSIPWLMVLQSYQLQHSDLCIRPHIWFSCLPLSIFTSVKSVLPCKVTWLWGPGIRCGHLWGTTVTPPTEEDWTGNLDSWETMWIHEVLKGNHQ